MNSIKVKAYAKINWALNITGEAPNGYHLLDMLMQSISLHDTLTINKDEAQGLCIIGSNELTCSDDNLIIKAKKALEELKTSKSVGIFIGPEGGFETKEVEFAKHNGGKIISLGKRILRTETAAITAVSMCMLNIEMN